MSLLGRAGRRYHLRHPAQFGLALAGIALGVAVVVAIDLANESATRSFAVATDATAGRVTDQIAGDSNGFDEAVFARLRLGTASAPGVRASAPVVEDVVVVPPAQSGAPADREHGRILRLLGVDPWSEVALRRSLGGAFGGSAGTNAAAGGIDLLRFLTLPGAVLLDRATAKELGVALDGRIGIQVGGRRAELRLVGILDPPDAAAKEALRRVALVDIATAQEILELPGKLTRIDLTLPEGEKGEELRRDIRALLPPGVRLSRASSRPAALEQMTRAFRFNLRALSLLALLCGTFLIYNTMTFSVVQRRELFGRLRAIGVRRGEILSLVLSEAAVLGLVGSVLGLVVGVVLGRGLMTLVLQTIRDLYFTLAAGSFAISPLSLAKGVALGVGAALTAALPAALEAARTAPRTTLLRSELESGARDLARKAARLGLMAAVAGAIVLALATRSLPLSLGGFFLVLVGYSLVVPLVLARGLRWIGSRPRRGIGLFGRMGARAVAASISRTGIAVAALTLAVAVSIGIALMIGSFRRTVEIWLDGALQGDLYVSTPTQIPSRANLHIPPQAVERIRSLPGVQRINTLRMTLVESPGQLPARVVGIDLDRQSLAAFHFKEGDFAAVWKELSETDDAAILTEPFAYRRELHRGDHFELDTHLGRKSFRVAGVNYDYGSDQGVAMLPVESFRKYFGDPGVAVLAVFATPQADLLALKAAIESGDPVPPAGTHATGASDATDATEGLLLAQSSRALKQMSVEIFDRTFRITGVLRLLAIAVAFLGILAALAAVELERGREFAVMRAQGLTRRQLLRLIAAETGWMGLAAGLFALPLGALLAALMVHVINRRSFGWSMDLLLTPRPFIEAMALALGAALLAGLIPAWRLGRTDPALALKLE
ncbi:MAG: FtsX-like permease family protein [Thermoanaerobaculia bacterium]